MNHLVVGVNGTIGSALFSRLQSAGVGVRGTTHKTEKTLGDTIFYLNLADNPSAWRFPSVKFDVAYFCAGVCRMSLCEDDPAGASKVNIDGTAALARRLSQDGTFIVYLSTNQVFSGKEPFVLPDASYEPLNEYGRQKAKIEQIIKADCASAAIIRLTKVVERNMPLIKNWIERLTSLEPVEAFQDMMLAPVSLRQVVDVLLAIGQKKQSGCYHLSGEADISYFDLACYLASSLDCPLSLINSVSALEKGMKKIFLPQFTTLDCSSTIALCQSKPPHFSQVVRECFEVASVRTEFGNL